MEMIINRFERELLRAETSVNTIKAYKSDLAKFYDYIKINLGDDIGFEESLSLIEYRELEDFVFYLEDKNYSRSTINRVIMALKTFFNYYSKYTGSNPSQGLKGYKKTMPKQKKILTKEEVGKILNQTQTKRYGEKNVDFNSQRDRFLLALLSTTGLRIEEALSIKLKDIDDYENYKMININIHNEDSTKLNKRVPIAGKVLEYYKNYISEYEKKSGFASFGSDSLYSSPIPHPRSYHGTVEYLSKYVLGEHILPLEESIRRMTGENAERVGLKFRGLVKEGYYADLLLISPENLRVNGDRNEGIEMVMVNGEIRKRGNEIAGRRSGMIL